MEYAKKAVAEVNAPDANMLETLAEAYYVNHRFAEAIETIQKAISLDSKNAGYRERLKKYEKAKALGSPL